MSGLLVTKLYRPALPPKRVGRPRLIEKLNEGLQSGRQVALVSAPAGFGKTVCVAEWLEGLDLPATWLSLDASDDDPGRFFSYLVAALQTVDASLGKEIQGTLRAGQLPPAEIISTTLANDIQALPRPFVLVLDDFQVLQDAFILGILGNLLTDLPGPLRLALLTREDPSLPLARLRANNQLTEIRAADLRFSLEEACSLLNEVMGLSLGQPDVARLEERTEGWVVGLQLAGLSIRDRPDRSTFIATLSGSHRFILGYLTEEVLAAQTEGVRRFLLQTSILDRLNGGLCDAVTGRGDSRILLERLYNANLFLVALDDEGGWYRYHQLFADLLRDRQEALLKRDSAALHGRASRWYAEAGMAGEAVRHALAARDYAGAVELIDSHALDMLMQWHLQTVEAWMRAIPPEWVAQSPRANLAFAWTYLMRGNHEQALPFLGRLGALFADPAASSGDHSLKAKWLAIQSMLLNAQGNPSESLRLCERALEIAPPGDLQLRSLVYQAQAGAYQQLDDYDKAAEAYRTLIGLGRAAGNSVSELVGVSALALLAIQRGQLHFAFEIASQALDRMERSGSLPPVSMAVYGELGVVYYQWHQLEEAHRQFRRAIQVGALSGYSDAALFYSVILSRLYQIQGNLQAASDEIRKAVDLMKVEAAAVVREEVIAQQVRIQLAQGDLAGAESMLIQSGECFRSGISFPDIQGQPVSRLDAVLYVSALRLLLQQVRKRRESGRLRAGLRLAGELIAGALEHGYVGFALEVLLVRAQLHAALGDDLAGQADYRRALELGQPEGFVSIFVEEGSPAAAGLGRLDEADGLPPLQKDYLRRIQTAFAESGPAPAAEPPPGEGSELLTDRELDVLRLMAEGLRYGEIASRLYISLNTVRSHVKAAYGKLGVNNRTRALEAGRRLGLV